MDITRSYSELINLETFEERYMYLLLSGGVGNPTFSGHRYLNQKFYNDPEWKKIRREIIIRDEGCDLGHKDYPISSEILIHHLNPITIDDILYKRSCIFDSENLICVSFKTHNAIHYGNKNYLRKEVVVRKQNDTCPWR